LVADVQGEAGDFAFGDGDKRTFSRRLRRGNWGAGRGFGGQRPEVRGQRAEWRRGSGSGGGWG
jgi:hypothetical protein